MKKEAVLSGLLLAVFAGFGAYGWTHRPVAHAQPSPCIAAANEQCPSADWLKDYEGWKKLDDEINVSEKPKKDLRTGWAARLNDSMPPGYYFNTDTHKFQKRELPAAPKAK